MSFNFSKNIYNPAVTALGYIAKKTTVSNLPSIACIEVTNHCNLNCIICSRRYSDRALGMMDMDLFADVVRQTKNSSRFTWLHLLGEPLLNKNIYDMIKLCKSNSLKVGLSTNATLLNYENSKKLLKTGLDSIVLAFDGVSKETYESVRTGGVFEKVSENIDTFLRLKKEMKKTRPWTVIQTVEINFTESEIEQFKNKWKDKNVDEVLIRKYSTSAGQLEDKDEVALPEHRYLCKQKKDRPPCFLLWNSAVIFWDGKVSTCCHDCVKGRLVFGNLKEDSLANIWNSEKIKKLRQKHLEGKFPSICKDCLEYPLVQPSLGSFAILGFKKMSSKMKTLKQKDQAFVTHAREQEFF